MRRSELGTKKAELAARIREAYDTDRTSILETFLSGGSFTDVHLRRQLHQRLRRARQGLAQQIVGRPGGARDDPRDGRVDPRPDRRRSAPRRSRRRQELDSQLEELKAAQAELTELETRDGAGAGDPARPHTPSSSGTRRTSPSAIADDAEGPAHSSRRRSRTSSRSSSSSATSRRSTTARCLADAGHRHAGVRLHRTPGYEPPATAARTSTTGSTSSRPAAAARRSRPPAPGASATSAGTTRTAPTRPGS